MALLLSHDHINIEMKRVNQIYRPPECTSGSEQFDTIWPNNSDLGILTEVMEIKRTNSKHSQIAFYDQFPYVTSLQFDQGMFVKTRHSLI